MKIFQEEGLSWWPSPLFWTFAINVLALSLKWLFRAAKKLNSSDHHFDLSLWANRRIKMNLPHIFDLSKFLEDFIVFYLWNTGLETEESKEHFSPPPSSHSLIYITTHSPK